MPLDVLTPAPLKLHVRKVRQDDAQLAQFELYCRLTLPMDQPIPMPQRLLLEARGGMPNATIEWSVWKRFEDFQAFDERMRARASPFAKMMVTVQFAPEHRMRVFFHQDQTAHFLEKRRKELDYYMQRILMLSDVAEFAAGSGSDVLGAFLEVGEQLAQHSISTNALLSPCSSRSGGSGLRDLHVELRASCGVPLPGENERRQSRKQYRQEIEDALLAKYGPAEYKTFKRHANAFRKENDALRAAANLIAFLYERYDDEQAEMLLLKFQGTIRSEPHRDALAAAAAEKLRPESRLSADSVQSTPSRSSHRRRATRPSSDKVLLEQVDLAARGNRKQVTAFKRAAKALGSGDLTPDAFVAFLRSTFGDNDARYLLRMTADAAPTPQLQQALRCAVIP